MIRTTVAVHSSNFKKLTLASLPLFACLFQHRAFFFAQATTSRREGSMRIVHLSLLTVALFGALASAQWNVSPDCRRRRTFDPNEALMSAVMKRSESVSPDRSLRGSEGSANRQLQQGRKMLRMHWEEGYCWQEEWEERFWCLQCDGSCDEDDNLVVEECDTNRDNQWFVIDAANNGIMLKPETSQGLCWTSTEGTDHRLKPCGGLDTQIINGFQETGSFELHPNGRDGECLVNDDHREYISQPC
jgi:hypothetical protein